MKGTEELLFLNLLLQSLSTCCLQGSWRTPRGGRGGGGGGKENLQRDLRGNRNRSYCIIHRFSFLLTFNIKNTNPIFYLSFKKNDSDPAFRLSFSTKNLFLSFPEKVWNPAFYSSVYRKKFVRMTEVLIYLYTVLYNKLFEQTSFFEDLVVQYEKIQEHFYFRFLTLAEYAYFS